MKQYRCFTLSLLASAVLTGCGSNDDNSTEAEFTAIDGYLRNALAWVDVNGNSILDAGEPFGRTNRNGKVRLKLEEGNILEYPVIVQAIPGETTDYDPESKIVRDIISEFYLSAPQGQKDITPLSTLVRQKVDSGLTIEEATTEVANLLGLPEEDVLGDFFTKKKKKAAKIAVSLVASKHVPTSSEEILAPKNNDNELAIIGQCSETVAEDFDLYCDDIGQTQPLPEGVVEEPTDPVDPVEPTDPEEPTDPVDPVEPTDPEEPTDPVDPVEPTDPEEPTDPIDPVEPTDPEEPTDPVEPVEPTDPEEPTDPVDPTDPVIGLDISALNEVRQEEFKFAPVLRDSFALTSSQTMVDYAQERVEALVASGEFEQYDYSQVKVESLFGDPTKDVGEIRYLSSTPNPTVAEAVVEWQAQGATFDITAFNDATNRYITACSDEKPCYNYAQIVTGRATEVGCATESYTSGSLDGQYALVCVFDKAFIPRYRAYSSYTLTAEEHQAYVDQHNAHRENHFINKPLAYNEILELEVQDFLDISTKLGLWRHSAGDSEINPDLKAGIGVQGENLWKGGGKASLDGATRSWYENEINNLLDKDSGDSTCKTGRVCGHATQVAWQKTRLVACGRSFYGAPENGQNQNQWIAGCRYWPAGNYSGQRFFCPQQGENDILFEAPHVELPYSAESIIPFTESALTTPFTVTQYSQKRGNNADCALEIGEPSSFDLASNYLTNVTLRVYVAAGGVIKPVTGPYTVYANSVTLNDIGQLEIEGEVLEARSLATIKLTLTNLKQRNDGSHIVEMSYELEEDLSAFGGKVIKQKNTAIFLME